MLQGCTADVVKAVIAESKLECLDHILYLRRSMTDLPMSMSRIGGSLRQVHLRSVVAEKEFVASVQPWSCCMLPPHPESFMPLELTHQFITVSHVWVIYSDRGDVIFCLFQISIDCDDVPKKIRHQLVQLTVPPRCFNVDHHQSNNVYWLGNDMPKKEWRDKSNWSGLHLGKKTYPSSSPSTVVIVFKPSSNRVCPQHQQQEQNKNDSPSNGDPNPNNKKHSEKKRWHPNLDHLQSGLGTIWENTSTSCMCHSP